MLKHLAVSPCWMVTFFSCSCIFGTPQVSPEFVGSTLISAHKFLALSTALIACPPIIQPFYKNTNISFRVYYCFAIQIPTSSGDTFLQTRCWKFGVIWKKKISKICWLSISIVTYFEKNFLSEGDGRRLVWLSSNQRGTNEEKHSWITTKYIVTIVMRHF